MLRRHEFDFRAFRDRNLFYVYAISNGSKIHNLILCLRFFPSQPLPLYSRCSFWCSSRINLGVDAVEGAYHENHRYRIVHCSSGDAVILDWVSQRR